jgi:hypothetical protein
VNDWAENKNGKKRNKQKINEGLNEHQMTSSLFELKCSEACAQYTKTSNK